MRLNYRNVLGNDVEIGAYSDNGLDGSPSILSSRRSSCNVVVPVAFPVPVH